MTGYLNRQWQKFPSWTWYVSLTILLNATADGSSCVKTFPCVNMNSTSCRLLPISARKKILSIFSMRPAHIIICSREALWVSLDKPCGESPKAHFYGWRDAARIYPTGWRMVVDLNDKSGAHWLISRSFLCSRSNFLFFLFLYLLVRKSFSFSSGSRCLSVHKISRFTAL